MDRLHRLHGFVLVRPLGNAGNWRQQEEHTRNNVDCWKCPRTVAVCVVTLTVFSLSLASGVPAFAPPLPAGTWKREIMCPWGHQSLAVELKDCSVPKESAFRPGS